VADINFRKAGIHLVANRMADDYKAQRGVEIEGFVQEWMEHHMEDLTQEYKDDVFETFMMLIQP